MSRTVNVFALAITLVFATALHAEGKDDNTSSSPSPAAQQIMSFLDKNGDGKISKDESPEQLKTNFGYIDTNGDGVIDIKEAEVMAGYAGGQQAGSQAPATAKGSVTAGQIVSYLDKDGDGKISKDEAGASAELKPYFATLDANGDGLIDMKEAEVIAQYVGSQQAGAPTPATPTPATPGSMTAEQIVASMDQNDDGKIAKDEASDDLILFFADFDANSNDFIDIKEAEALKKYFGGEQAKSTQTTQPATGSLTAEQMIGFLDTDGDGKISKTEADASAELKPYFKQFDTNGDGAIDVKEAESIVQYAN